MDNITEKILNIVNDSIKDGDIIVKEQADEDLSALGMDSITFIRIVVAFEESFEIEVPDEKLLITEMNTINKMIDVVSTTLGITNE